MLRAEAMARRSWQGDNQHVPKRPDAPQTFTVYWSAERIARLEQMNSSRRLVVFYGGPHQSQPSFLKLDVRPHDTLIPITLLRGQLHLLGHAVVEDVLLVDETEGTADAWRARFENWAWLAATCTTEVVPVSHGTRARTGIVAPADLLDAWRFVSTRGTRPIRQLNDGRVTSAAGIDSIYRLDETTAAAVTALTKVLSACR